MALTPEQIALSKQRGAMGVIAADDTGTIDGTDQLISIEKVLYTDGALVSIPNLSTLTASVAPATGTGGAAGTGPAGSLLQSFTQKMADIRGLTVSHPILGWGLILGVVTIVGLPPMGIFMSEFLLITSTFARAPALAVVLGVGLLIAMGALLYRLNGMAFGEAHGDNPPVQASYVPLFMHLALVLAAGIYLPPLLVSWFQHVAELLG